MGKFEAVDCLLNGKIVKHDIFLSQINIMTKALKIINICIYIVWEKGQRDNGKWDISKCFRGEGTLYSLGNGTRYPMGFGPLTTLS